MFNIDQNLMCTIYDDDDDDDDNNNNNNNNNAVRLRDLLAEH